MHVEIGAEAAQFPEKENINGIAVAVLPAQWQIPPYLISVQSENKCCFLYFLYRYCVQLPHNIREH